MSPPRCFEADCSTVPNRVPTSSISFLESLPNGDKHVVRDRNFLQTCHPLDWRQTLYIITDVCCLWFLSSGYFPCNPSERKRGRRIDEEIYIHTQTDMQRQIDRRHREINGKRETDTEVETMIYSDTERERERER